MILHLLQGFNDMFILILTFLIVLLLSTALYNELSLPKDLPPGPFRIPVMGHLPFVKYPKYLSLINIGKKYGSVYRLFLGNRLVIVLNDYKAIKEAFLANAEIFSGRPKNDFITAYPGNEDIASVDGIFWRQHRRFALTLLRDCGVGNILIEPRILEEIFNLISHLKPLNGVAKDLTALLTISVANNISIIVLGKKFQYTDPEFLSIKQVLKTVPTSSSSLVAHNFLPWLKYIPGYNWFSSRQVVHSMTKKFNEFLKKIINELKLNHVQGQQDDYPRAFLTEKNARLMKDPNDTIFNDTALLSNMRTIMNAGTETTTTTLLWGFIYMMLHPTVQKKVQDELDAVIGVNRNVSWNDRRLTPYTQATLCEIQRMASIVPVNLPHRCKEECEILGYKIPKDSFIVSNLHNALHEPSIWQDPDVFRPERFLTENGTFTKPEYFIPFSLGKRQCMGEILARMELYLYFAILLQHFTFKAPEGVKPSLDYKLGTIRAPKHFVTCAIPRNHN